MPRRYVLPTALLAPAPIGALVGLAAGVPAGFVGFMLAIYLLTMGLIGGFTALVLWLQLRFLVPQWRALARERGGRLVGVSLGDPSIELPGGAVLELCTRADSLGAARAGRYSRWTRLRLPVRGGASAVVDLDAEGLGPVAVHLGPDGCALWLPGYLEDPDRLRRLLQLGPELVEAARARGRQG